MARHAMEISQWRLLFIFFLNIVLKENILQIKAVLKRVFNLALV